MSVDESRELITKHFARQGKIIAKCHFQKHPGYLTKKLLEAHKCIEKKCVLLEKIDHPYWEKIEKKRLRKEERKKEGKIKEAYEAERDSYIKEVLNNEYIYITAITEAANIITVAYIYNRDMDLTTEIKELEKVFDKSVHLKSVSTSEKIRVQLIAEAGEHRKKS